jgi:class 3 adenylate cyclase/tetratricopeptide (TPR) repeat protein
VGPTQTSGLRKERQLTPYASPVSACPSCGHENEPGAKFCSECGTALREARPAPRTERKVVTVLFADLVGFTARAERLDPEDVQAVLEPYHTRLRAELERFGGTVEKFIGDAVMALFGAPTAHEDDPERAVRAALAIRDWIAEEGKLEVRIGVNTGEVLVNLAARPERGEGMATGDVVNATARIETAAPVNGILVGESTYRATANVIDYGEPTTIDAKGKEEPVAVWEARQARSRYGVDVVREAATPLVGRSRELDVLKAALSIAQQQQSPELVTLVGVPGIGKSRLVAELFAWVEQEPELVAYWRQGRSLPYGEGVSYWALSEMVKAQTGILETDEAGEAEAKLASTLEDLLDEDVEWVHSHLRPLIGQASSSDAESGQREEAFAAWRRFFEALAERHPLVLVFEDIHWADDGLLDFIEHLIEWVTGVPMLVLCTARLELLERRPAWGGGKLNAATVSVAPLTDDETATLISALSARPLLEADTQSALMARAGGNPLYAEQFVRMLAERAKVDDLSLPESVQGIIAARLDSLPAEEKALLQDAAVVGKVFWLGALAADGNRGELERRLHALERKEFVQRARRASVAGETEFAFKHLLVRDVAYGQIPRAERSDKHLRVAQWIESLGRPEDQAEMVAHHYLSALELRRAAGRDFDDLTGRARVALREAGDRAAALNALQQAQHYYAEALELTPEDDPGRPELLLRHGRMQHLRSDQGRPSLEAARAGFIEAGNRANAAEAALMLATVAWNAGSQDETYKHLADARDLVADEPPSRIQVEVLSNLSRYEMLADRNERAVEWGLEALRMAEQLGLDDLRGHALNNIGSARVFMGNPEGVSNLKESIAIASRLGLTFDLLRGHNNLSTIYFTLGELDRGRVERAQTRELAERFGHYGFVRFIDGGPAVIHPYTTGSWDEALERAEAFVAEVEGGSPHYQAPHAYVHRALIRLGRGDATAAVQDAERAVELAREVKDPQLFQTTLDRAAVVFLAVGNDGRAAEIFGEILAKQAGLNQLGFASVDSYALAWLGVVLGREEDVGDLLDSDPLDTPWIRAGKAVLAGDLAGAADLLGEIGALSQEAFLRLRAAEQLVHAGRRVEADEQLNRALAFYRSVGATRHVREGEALLAASA